MSGTAGISCTTRPVCCVRAQPTIKGPSSQRRLNSWRRQPSARVHVTAALPEILPALETSSWVPQEAVQLVADLASNLGVLDPGPGDSDLAANWDVAKGASTFEPGVRVDPAAVFACVLLGVFGLDASLQSMNVPFIGSRVRRYARDRKAEKRRLEMEEYDRRMAERATDDINKGGDGQEGRSQ